MDPMFLIILVVGLGALLFMNWRTRKKQQEQLSFRDQLQPGQQVQTIGGLVGTVVAVEDDRVILASTPGTEVVFVKQALARLIEDPVVDLDDEDEADQTELESSSDDASTDTATSGNGGQRDFSKPLFPESGDKDNPRD